MDASTFEIVGLVLVWAGVIFSVIGVYGMTRFNDVYNRLHASGVISTLGIACLLFGVGFMVPDAALNLLALGIFIFLTAPMATHAIALAAWRLVSADREERQARHQPVTQMPGRADIASRE